jgi:hypothetical protein
VKGDVFEITESEENRGGSFRFHEISIALIVLVSIYVCMYVCIYIYMYLYIIYVKPKFLD